MICEVTNKDCAVLDYILAVHEVFPGKPKLDCDDAISVCKHNQDFFKSDPANFLECGFAEFVMHRTILAEGFEK
jgi:hypothetical protein